MSIPNLITLGRIIITPIFLCFYLEGKQTAAMWLLALAAVSDMLDGAVARRFNMVTKLGKALDPVADKLLQLAMLLCLVKTYPAVRLLLALHVLRELCLGTLGLLSFRRHGEVLAARWYGKLCTAVMYTVLGALLLFPALPEKPVELALLLCGGLVLLCLFLYAGEYLRLLRAGREKAA